MAKSKKINFSDVFYEVGDLVVQSFSDIVPEMEKYENIYDFSKPMEVVKVRENTSLMGYPVQFVYLRPNLHITEKLDKLDFFLAGYFKLVNSKTQTDDKSKNNSGTESRQSNSTIGQSKTVKTVNFGSKMEKQ